MRELLVYWLIGCVLIGMGAGSRLAGGASHDQSDRQATRPDMAESAKWIGLTLGVEIE